MIDNCKLVYVDGVANAFDNDGEKSKLFEEALKYTDGNQEEAIKIWASTQSEEFLSEVGEEKPSLQTALRFLNNRVEKPQSLSMEELKEVSLMMSDMGISDLGEFTEKMNNMFQPNGFYEVDSKKLMKSGMFSTEDITELNHVAVKNFLEKLNYFNAHKDFNLRVAPKKTKIQLRNTTAKKTPIGSYPLVSEQELVEYLVDNADDLSTPSIMRAIGESPFAQILDDKKALKAVTGMLAGKTKVNKMFFDGENFTSENIDTFVTLRNTLLANVDPIELEADLEFIESITPTVWDSKQPQIKNVLKEIERTAIKYNIDIIGLNELSNDRETVLSLLSSLDDMLLIPSVENIKEFARKKDEKITPNKPYTVIQLKDKYKNYNIVKIDTNLSDDIMFQKGFLRVDNNRLYHRVQRAEIAEMYDLVYEMVQDNTLIIPSNFFPKEMNIKDPINRDVVMGGIVNYINSRDTGMDTLMVEEVSLMQTIFAHEKIKKNVPQDVVTDEEYLKTGFVSDFYNYVLQEKQKSTDLYNKVLRHFTVTDADITLDALETPDVSGIKFEQELRDYSRLKKDGQIKDLEKGETKNEDLIVLNNPQRVLEEQGTNYVLGENGYVLTDRNPKKYITVGGKLHRKLFDKSNGTMYKEVVIPKNTLYFDNNLNFDFNRKEAESAHKKLSKSLQKTTPKPTEELSKNVNIPNTLMPIQFQIIGEQGARNLDQAEEATFRMDNLLVAKEMEQAGKTPLEIRLATGWERGADSLWRYEILDGKIKDVKINFNRKHRFFKENVAKIKLSDLIDNSELFKAYPQLSGINVYVYDTNDELLANNKMFVLDNEIFINREDYDNKRGGLEFSDGERGDILHEIEHLIQTFEGFSKGGSRGWARQRVNEAVLRIREKGLERTIEDGYASEGDRIIVEHLKTTPLKDVLDTLLHKESEVSSLAIAESVADEVYLKLAGEVEARNVQTRLSMTSEQRRQTLLKETEDVAREDQIFLRNNVQFQIIGEQGASRMLEYKQQLDLAKELEKEGKTPAQIELETGWYKYKGDWRTIPKEVVEAFQIKDRTVNKELTLKQVLGEDNVLFKFYPQVGETKVVFLGETYEGISVPNDIQQSLGLFSKKDGTIFINTFTDKDGRGGRERISETDIRKTLGHEVNHRLQQIEGFPVGGDRYSVIMKAREIVKSDKTSFQDLYEDMIAFDTNNLSENEKVIINSTIKAFEQIRDYKNDYPLTVQYYHLMGEIDSRIVEEALMETSNYQTVSSYSALLAKVAMRGGINLDNVTLLYDNEGFNISFSPQKDLKETVEEVINKLKQTGLSEEVFQLNTQQLLEKLREIGVSDDIAMQVTQQIKNGYYSNAQTAFTNLKDKNVKNIQGWIKALTDVQKNGGIKNVNQELEWIGLEDYLNEYVKENNPKNGNISASVVEEYILSNQIDIIEVSKGGRIIEPTILEDATYNNINEELSRRGIEDDNDLLNQWYYAEEGKYQKWEDVVTFLENNNVDSEYLIEKSEVDSSTSDNTKYSAYQLKGGENYREVLLTMPDKRKKVFGDMSDTLDYITDTYGINSQEYKSEKRRIVNILEDEWVLDDEAIKDLFNTYEKSAVYKSSHWNETNVLAHVRLNEKTLPDGRRVLIVNEIQSDFSQDIRKGTTTLKSPYANTDQWVGLVSRRVMQMASEEGYDGIAFATGQQSADMYSLSNQVDKINITPQGGIKAVYISMKNNADDTVFINQEGVITESASGAYNGKKAEEVLGKDLTRKILETEEETTLEGEGLEFGGEGMKTFYDKIVPKVVQKEAQRFDKSVKLETVNLDDSSFVLQRLQKIKEEREITTDDVRYRELGKEAEALRNSLKDEFGEFVITDKLALGVQPYLPLTNSIKESVSQGIPQFQKALSQQRVNLIPNGFIYKNQVYLNTDTMTPDLVFHEFQHLFLNWAKEARPDIYNRGIELARKELEKGENSEIQDVINYVRQTQPNLKGEALENEVITEFIGRYSKQMMDEQKAKSPLMQWLSDFWTSIKQMLGITEMTPAQVANLSLQEYAKASVVSLSKGENFTGTKGEQNFNRWKGENELVAGSAIQDVRTGQPIVVKAYHGTTNEFYEFDSSVKGNIEGHLGKINYFTSDYQDATQNYLSEGADITGRIDIRQDELEDTLRYEYQSSEEGLNFQEIIDDFNITEEEVKELYPSGKPEFIQAKEISRFLAEKELKGNTEQGLELYVKLNNPIVLGNGATWFDALEIDETYLEEATQEVMEEYGVTEQEAKDEYDYEIRDRAVEKQGDGNKILSALEQALNNNGYDERQAISILGDNYYEETVDLNRLEQSIRNADLYDNYDGEFASSQVIADFFKNLGFDGIILTDVSERFKGMRLSPSTSHIHVFDEYNNQIKLADGSNTTFNPKTPDIRFQKIIYDARVETRAEMFQMINDYGIVINNLYPKSKEDEIKDKFDECRI